jgi:RNA-binding protein
MNTAFKQTLKAKAHHLNPVIMIGSKGLTASVIDETDITLNAHELIKIKITGMDKNSRQLVVTTLCDQLHAKLVQIIGTIAIIYRKNND